ncbi:MAG TPA: hypothetical protein VFE62_04150, partial [Gemmataceae bacterium]|nr:hypothetical protein [Gemmataceae bacterium]
PPPQPLSQRERGADYNSRMGAWRTLRDYLRTIVGIGVLLVVAIVVAGFIVAGLLIFVDPDMLAGVGIKKIDALKTDEEKKAAQRETLNDFIKRLPVPGAISKKTVGRPVGKIVVVSNNALDPLQNELPAALAAKAPENIDAVAVVTQTERVIGVYNNGILFPAPAGANTSNAAKVAILSISIIEPGSGERIHVSPDLVGPPPPAMLPKGGAAPAPEPPRALALKYLTMLPRKATGKVVLSVDGTLADSDRADPVLAKSAKLAKIRTHMKDHTIALDSNKAYVIAVESDAFDPYLRVELAGKQIASHHDAYGTHKARIAITPTQAAEYRICVACYDGKTGEYRLLVQEAEEAPSNP